ncbi:MAG: hypothetical protein QW100_02350 [Thermoplasmatales archaeon]
MGIDVKYLDLHSQCPYHDGYAWPAKREIAIERSIRGTRQERAVLAEEIAHFLFGIFADHVAYHDTRYWELGQWERDLLRASVAREERMVVEWASGVQISDIAFWRFKNTGPHEWWEWTEEFWVPDWILQAKVGLIRTKMRENGLRPFRWRDLIKR